MNFDELVNQIPDHAKDIRLNIKRVLTREGSPDLSLRQINAIALAASYAAGNTQMRQWMETQVAQTLDDDTRIAAKAAHSIMAMNNIYYRFVHAMEDAAWMKLPADLRMNVIAKPGTDKVTFELMCLAVSMINGCGLCMKSHANALQRHDVSQQGIQSTARIAAVVNAVAKSLEA